MAASSVVGNTFRSTALEKFAPLARASESEAAEARFWARFKVIHTHNFPSAITHACFAPGETRAVDGAPVIRLACATGLNVQVVSVGRGGGSSMRMLQPVKTKVLGRFKSGAYGASWRSNGRMIAAADGDTGRICALDSITGASLRVFFDKQKGHAKGVSCRATAWGGASRLLSGGDDGSAVLWDVSTGNVVDKLDKVHSDSIRSLCRIGSSSDEQNNMWSTAGYDGVVKVWDLRLRSETSGPVRSFVHGAPVEAVVSVSSSMIASGGGHKVALWDLLSSAPVHSFENAHSRACSSLCVDSAKGRLVSGGHDSIVKVHSLRDLATVHSQRHAAPVLSVALYSDDNEGGGQVLAVGLATGALELRRRERAQQTHATRPKTLAPPSGTFRHFQRGKNFTPSADDDTVQIVADDDDATAKRSAKRNRPKLAPHDEALKSFRYGDALDEALGTGEPLTVVSVLAELDRRGGSRMALVGRDEPRLEPLLSFLVVNLTNPRFSKRLVRVADLAFDLYSHALGKSPALDELFAKLHAALATECAAQTALAHLAGTIATLVTTSDLQH